MPKESELFYQQYHTRKGGLALHLTQSFSAQAMKQFKQSSFNYVQMQVKSLETISAVSRTVQQCLDSRFERKQWHLYVTPPKQVCHLTEIAVRNLYQISQGQRVCLLPQKFFNWHRPSLLVTEWWQSHLVPFRSFCSLKIAYYEDRMIESQLKRILKPPASRSSILTHPPWVCQHQVVSIRICWSYTGIVVTELSHLPTEINEMLLSVYRYSQTRPWQFFRPVSVQLQNCTSVPSNPPHSYDLKLSACKLAYQTRQSERRLLDQ